jgi:cytochrome c oxidase cbb3-type subunit 3
MTEQKHPEEQILQEGDPDTTGHVWDGIKEFNNPLPRWWLWTFYACIVWGVIYTVLYPAWPLLSTSTAGLIGFSTRGQVAADIASFEEMNAPVRARIEEVELAAINPEDNADLYNFAVNGGAALFRTWCAQCHGSGANGVADGNGYPSLLDDDWLWGGRIDEIHYTISHGIRNEDDPDARYSVMTAFDEVLTDEEIDSVVQYVLSISNQSHDATLATAGEEVFLNNCASCHGEGGVGSLAATRDYQGDGEYAPNDEMTGAPNLSDAIWLYGSSAAEIEQTVRYARFGVMPPWSAEASAAGRLSEAEVRSLAVYVHSLGGGE